MKVIETTGKTIDEAIENALKELNAHRDDVEVEILEVPSRGIFGIIGCKAARVKVTMIKKELEETVEAVNEVEVKEIEKAEIGKKEKPEDLAIDFLQRIFDKLEVKVHSEVNYQGEFIYLSFTGDDLGILIGRRGETLDALQYLVNLVVSKKIGEKVRFILDVEGYRKRREETLVNLAHRLSEKVKKTGHNIILEPMNPHERRIIHTALQNDQRVRTFSEGEEPYRKVIITRRK
ncbi:MAG: RNA-binding cell elongation regulator Jag/EloR [Bacillota bacterium]|jgi:spoIIIJ-associated protein